jgi:hypothetical protein
MQPLVTPGAGPIPGVPQHQPSNLFRFGEITLYSTTQLVAGAIANTNNRLFTTPLGQTGQGWAAGMTVSETNLKEGGRIPSGQAYDVFGVATQVMAMTANDGNMSLPFVQAAAAAGAVPDLQNVVNNGVLVWDFTQTQVFISPVMLAGAGGGVYGAIASTAAATPLGAMNNGNGGIWMYRKHPVALPGSSTFAVECQFGVHTAALGTAVAVRVVLLGYYKSVIEIG